jgi:hypothetical protein
VFPDAYVARDMDHFVLYRGRPVEKRQATYQEVT